MNSPLPIRDIATPRPISGRAQWPLALVSLLLVAAPVTGQCSSAGFGVLVPAFFPVSVTNVCPGQPETLTYGFFPSVVPFGSPPYTLAWSGAYVAPTLTGITSFPVNVSVDFVGTQGTAVTGVVTLSDASGVLCTESYTHFLSSPSTGPVQVSGTQTICPGGSAVISAVVPLLPMGPFGGAGTLVLVWSDGVTEFSTPQSGVTTYTFTRTVTPTTTTTYTAQANFLQPLIPGCPVPSTGSATVTVAGPTAAISGGVQPCSGGARQVSATLGSPTAGPFSWDIVWSDGVTETVTSPTQPYVHSRWVAPPTTTVYTITSVDDGVCTNTGTGSATVNVPSVTVTSTNLVFLGGAQLTVNGSGFSPILAQSRTIYFHQIPLPTTFVSSTQLTAQVPVIGPAGGAPVYVEVRTGCSTAISNAVPLVWDQLRTNRGTIINLTTGGAGGPSTLTFRVEGGEPNQPLSMVADVGDPYSTFLQPLTLFGNQAVSTYSANSLPIVDGLGILGVWGIAPPASLDSTGGFELTLALPASVSGLPFRLQAIYQDPSASAGFSLTWPLEAFVP